MKIVASSDFRILKISRFDLSGLSMRRHNFQSTEKLAPNKLPPRTLHVCDITRAFLFPGFSETIFQLILGKIFVRQQNNRPLDRVAS